MKIIDVCGNNVKACCQFNYKGFEVSFSTIMNCKVVAFDLKGDMVCEEDTVEDVLIKCDKMLDEQTYPCPECGEENDPDSYDCCNCDTRLCGTLAWNAKAYQG